MPAWRLTEDELPVRHFDVGANDGAQPDFPAHLALCLANDQTTVRASSANVQTVHMGPPLGEVTQEISSLGTTLEDVEELPPNERRKIKAFVDDRQGERLAQEDRLKRLRGRDKYYAEYVIHPPAVPPKADVSLWRFSCVGFVLEAYDEAGIELIEPSDLPDITLDTLKKAYPGFARRLDREDVRQELGIGGEEPWPVALPGYVLNSLRRKPDAIRSIPYKPQSGDEYFTDGGPVASTAESSGQAKSKPGKSAPSVVPGQSEPATDDSTE